MVQKKFRVNELHNMCSFSQQDTDTMNEDEDKAAKRQRRAAQYKRDVASGKQKVYNSNDKARKQNKLREQKVERAREFLKDSNEMHLEGAVTTMIQEIPKGRVIKDRMIRSYINYCRREYELKKLLTAARASDATVVATSIVATGSTCKDALGEDTLVVSTGGRTNTQPDGAEASAMAKQNAPNQSDDADTPALITPHKPEEDASGVETEKQSNDDNNALDDDDHFMHCHDDDSIDGNFMDNSNEVGLDSSSNSKPAPLVAPKEEGQPCFVLISNNVSTEQHPSPTLYWPALLYSSKDALQSDFPFRNNNDRLSVQVECGKNERACGIGNYPAGEVKVAILLGSDVPPCRTRSVPVPVSHDFVRPGRVAMPYHVAFTKKKANNLRKMTGYADSHKFLEALDMLERYNNSKNLTILSSMKYT